MRTPFFPRVCFVLLVGALLTGCAAGSPSGKWEEKPGVQQLFESGTLLPDHTYYFLGSSAAPDSIIAISNQFTLRTRVWARVDISQEILDSWLRMYRTEHYSPGCEFRGGVIFTPDGRQAGVWYSQNIINIIKMPEPGVLEVYQPRSISGAVCGQNDDGGFAGRMF
jgi:hypothetical protein